MTEPTYSRYQYGATVRRISSSDYGHTYHAKLSRQLYEFIVPETGHWTFKIIGGPRIGPRFMHKHEVFSVSFRAEYDPPPKYGGNDD